MKTRQCKSCSKIFTPHGEFTSKNGYVRRQIYCSKECYAKKNPPKLCTCLNCSRTFKKRVQKYEPGLYCSRKCYAEYDESWRKKRRNPHMTKEMMQSPEYKSVHHWIKKALGRPCECWGCDKKGGSPRQYNWANADHQYQRIVSEWFRLCVTCHRYYDKGDKSQEWVDRVIEKAKHHVE